MPTSFGSKLRELSTNVWTDGVTLFYFTTLDPDDNAIMKSLILTDLTPNRLLYGNGSKSITSVASLTSWIAGTANQVGVVDDGDGTITIKLVNSNTTRIVVGNSPYIVLSTDNVIYCDTDGGAIEVDLPAGVEGTHYKIINCGSSGNALTVDPNGAEVVYGLGAGVAATLADGQVIDLNYNATEGWW